MNDFTKAKTAALTAVALCFFTAISAQVQLDSTQLPILIVTTEGLADIPDEPKISAHLGIVWNGDGHFNHPDDPFTAYDGQIGIERRGSSSQGFPKNNFAVETQNLDGTSLNVSVLGFPEENDWVLHGPYSDKSLMRNAIAFTLGGWIMDYAPRVRFCELIVNGDYRGVYVFTEKIKQDKNRVDISKLNPDENTGDDLTGGYILKFDKFDGAFSDGFPSAYPPIPGGFGTTYYQYHYPKPDEITEPQKAYIQNYIADFENVMASPNYEDPINGYRKFLDVESVIHMIFIQEIARNVDGYRLSTYLYKDRESVDNRLYLGPVWDYNLGFGNVDYCIGAGTAGWALDFNDYCPGDFWAVHFWWQKLMEDTTFRSEMREKWLELRAAQLSNDRIHHLIDSFQVLLNEPAMRNFERWPTLDEYVWPNAVVTGSYTGEVNYLRNWLTARLSWLDGAMSTLNVPEYRPLEYFRPIVQPNPSLGPVTFRYYVHDSDKIEIKITNVNGHLVKVLRDFEHPNGENSAVWDDQVPAGVYFYEFSQNGRMQQQGKIVRQ